MAISAVRYVHDATALATICLRPGYTPLIDETAEGPAQLQPFCTALIAVFMLLFLDLPPGPGAGVHGARPGGLLPQ